MKISNPSTVDAILQKHPFLLVDSNAFIFHYPKELHQQLNDSRYFLEEKKNKVQPYQSLVLKYYQEWLRIIAQYSNLFVTSDVLDLELSGHFFLRPSTRKKYYSKYQSLKVSLPKGSILRDFDSPSVREIKKEFLAQLDQRCRINPKLKKRRPGFRQSFFQWMKLFFEDSLTFQQTSLIDQEHLTNLFAYSIDCNYQGTLLTNDRNLLTLTRLVQEQLQKEPNSSSLFPKFEQEELLLRKVQTVGYSWNRPEKREILLLYPSLSCS